jgi:hypothetical protein
MQTSTYFLRWHIDLVVKGEFAVVPTDNICGRSLSSKIPVDMNNIFIKLCHMTNVT